MAFVFFFNIHFSLFCSIFVESFTDYVQSLTVIVAEAFVLGFQHYVLTLGFSVLIPSLIVPQMGGGDVRHTFTRF